MSKLNFFSNILIDKRKKDSDIQQLYNQIKHNISQQIYEEGYILPNVSEIANKLNLADSDIQELLEKIAKEGYLVAQKQRYTVKFLRLTDTYFETIIPLNRAIEIAGYQSKFETLEQSICKTLPDYFKFVDTKDIEFFYYVKRLFYADDKPIFILEMYYNSSIFDNDKHINFKDMKTFEYLEKEKHLIMSRSVRHIKIVNPEASISKLLNIAEGSATTQIHSITYDQNGNFVEVAVGHAHVNYSIHSKATIHFDT